MSFLVPPALKPGATIRVIAPASPFDRALVLRGMGWLSERYRVSFDPGIFERTGFLAGSDQRRCEELDGALADRSIDAVVAARGGHGLLRIVDRVRWDLLQEAPKWLVGFSDLTAAHAQIWQRNIASLHGAMVGGLGRGDATTRESWISALEQPYQARVLVGRAAGEGCASGPLVGGNLTLLTMLAAAGRLSLPRGCILALEDVGESSYSIDRMLTVLALGGALDPVAGFAVGEFHECSAGAFKVPVQSVVFERLGRSRPVVVELPFGHGKNVCPLTFGMTAELDATRGTLTVACPS